MLNATCKHCHTAIRPGKRVCEGCQRERKRASNARQISRLAAWKAKMGHDWSRNRNRTWRNRHKEALKLQRGMGLPTIADARRVLAEEGRR